MLYDIFNGKAIIIIFFIKAFNYSLYLFYFFLNNFIEIYNLIILNNQKYN